MGLQGSQTLQHKKVISYKKSEAKQHIVYVYLALKKSKSNIDF